MAQILKTPVHQIFRLTSVTQECRLLKVSIVIRGGIADEVVLVIDCLSCCFGGCCSCYSVVATFIDVFVLVNVFLYWCCYTFNSVVVVAFVVVNWVVIVIDCVVVVIVDAVLIDSVFLKCCSNHCCCDPITSDWLFSGATKCSKWNKIFGIVYNQRCGTGTGSRLYILTK